MTVKFITGAGQIKVLWATGDALPTAYPNGRAIENGAAGWDYVADVVYITWDHGTHWVAHATGGSVNLLAGSAIIGNVRIDQTVAGTTNGVQVNAGTALMGAVMGIIKIASVTKALVAASAYGINDVLSESATVGTSWAFDVGRVAAAGGYITRATLLSKTVAVVPRCTLFLYNAAPTCVLNDNLANTGVLEADLAKYIGKIDFVGLESLGGDAEVVATPGTPGNLPMAFVCGANTTLYGVLVTRDAFTQTAGDNMTVKLAVEQY